jgi:predicted homoserine dehydrogenase-like protein
MKENLLPLGLAFNARAKKDIKKDEFITYDIVDLKETLLLDFRRKQDQLFST